MNEILGDLYYCHQCKRIVKDIRGLYFVEEGLPNGFCSEGCIESLYKNLVSYFDDLNKKIFNNLNLVEEIEADEGAIIESVLRQPSKVFQWSNELGTKITHFSGKVDSLYVVVSCFLYEGSASFILGVIYHKDPRILEFFKKGHEKDITHEVSSSIKQLSVDEIDFIEQRKGEFLAKLIEVHSESDIQFEAYALYERYVASVITSPDFKKRIDSSKMGEIYIYSKIIFDESKKIYFFVASLEKDQNKNTILFIPSFYSDLTNVFFESDNFVKN